MFAAYKKNAAKRKAARAAATQQFRERIAEVNEKRDIELALIRVEQEANNERFKERIRENNETLKAAWRQ